MVGAPIKEFKCGGYGWYRDRDLANIIKRRRKLICVQKIGWQGSKTRHSEEGFKVFYQIGKQIG